MKIYVDEQKRYEDTKATGQCFTGVGAIGLIAIVLLDTGVIKLAALDSVNKLMVSIVMGLVFLIFFIIGMKSFMELKDISKKLTGIIPSKRKSWNTRPSLIGTSL